MKAASENEPEGETPSMRARVLDRRVTLHEVFHRRLAPTLPELPERLAACCWRTVPTRVLPSRRRRPLKSAS
jgi:hypothetical protein